MGAIKVERQNYKGWENCLSLRNETVELIVTTDVGPRIISYGFINDRNEFCVWEEQAGKIGSSEWRCYGGSRLWHGPEIGNRCYEPDNEPVGYEILENGVVLYQKTESVSRIAKKIQITFTGGSEIKLHYTLTNTCPWDAEICIWALTLMQKNGSLIIPLDLPVRGIAPNSVLPGAAWAIWPYSTMADPRLKIEEEYLFLRQDQNDSNLFKLGMPIKRGWAAYVNDGHMFVKRFLHKEGEKYPDYNSSFEMFCCERFIEVETLSPMRKIGFNEILEHEEVWQLYDQVQTPKNSEEVKRIIEPLIREGDRYED